MDSPNLDRALRLKTNSHRGGVIEDVRFTNWTMEDVGQGINVTNYYLMEGEVKTAEEPVSKRTPVYRNIAIGNMTINRARVAINIEGLPEMPISGLRISDVAASGRAGLKASNTVGLELRNVQMNADSGPAFLVRDSKELELDAVSSRTPSANAPVIRLERCPGAAQERSDNAETEQRQDAQDDAACDPHQPGPEELRHRYTR
jgi:polygalacturonase